MKNKHSSFPGLPAKYKKRRRKEREKGVRTMTTFSKDPCKVVCHCVDTFQKKTSVFLPHFQTKTVFSINSNFNPAVTFSEALWHSQRDQLN